MTEHEIKKMEMLAFRRYLDDGGIFEGTIDSKSLIEWVTDRRQCIYHIIEPVDRLVSFLFMVPSIETWPKLFEGIQTAFREFGLEAPRRDFLILNDHHPEDSQQQFEFIYKRHRFNNRNAIALQLSVQKREACGSLVVDQEAISERLVIYAHDKGKQGVKRFIDHPNGVSEADITATLLIFSSVEVKELPDIDNATLPLPIEAFLNLSHLLPDDDYHDQRLMIAAKNINHRYRETYKHLLEERNIQIVGNFDQIWTETEDRFLGIWSYIYPAITTNKDRYREWANKYGVDLFVLIPDNFEDFKKHVTEANNLFEGPISSNDLVSSHQRLLIYLLSTLVYISDFGKSYYIAKTSRGLIEITEKQLKAELQGLEYLWPEIDPGGGPARFKRVSLCQFIEYYRDCLTYRYTDWLPVTMYNTPRLELNVFNRYRWLRVLPKEGEIDDHLRWQKEGFITDHFYKEFQTSMRQLVITPDKKLPKALVLVGHSHEEIRKLFDGIFDEEVVIGVNETQLLKGDWIKKNPLLVIAPLPNEKIVHGKLKEIVTQRHPKALEKDCRWTNFIFYTPALIGECADYLIYLPFSPLRPAPALKEERYLGYLLNLSSEEPPKSMEENGTKARYRWFSETFLWLDSQGNRIEWLTMSDLYDYYLQYIGSTERLEKVPRNFSTALVRVCVKLGKVGTHSEKIAYGPKPNISVAISGLIG